MVCDYDDDYDCYYLIVVIMSIVDYNCDGGGGGGDACGTDLSHLLAEQESR
jgi:hypothetical protein